MSALAPAHAIVGGNSDQGPLARATVMVLAAGGGMCSAVVVARDAVLTAAHCVTGAREHRVHFRDEAGQPAFIEPTAKAVHPGYDAKAIEARRRSIDLALLRLPQPLPPRFEAATLSAATVTRGVLVAIGGYGVVREGDARSTGTYRVARVATVEPHGPSRILVWASGTEHGGAGACEGDSGGPITRDDAGSVFAITTWATGLKGRGCGQYSQGVLLAPQRAWIDATLAKWGGSANWQ
ncbi:MAG TPA: trypsin-like serine protease [Beijerinckiaceae bacterium]|nr:trypsin-like serine protease [Beijerinckiaceae bacterium]